MIAVVDFGMGNLRSVSKAFETAGAVVEVTNDPVTIADADAIILPGVGAFRCGMENLNKLNLAPVICEAVEKKKPVFGICLGLQLFFTESEEHGICKGLDIIKGRVKRFDSSVKIPHVGWNQVKYKAKSREQSAENEEQRVEVKDQSAEFKVFDGIPDNSYFYFVHSYYVEPDDESLIAATTGYGKDFVSVINVDNLWGVQFHPEKSSELGLKVLKNFLTNILLPHSPYKKKTLYCKEDFSRL